MTVANVDVVRVGEICFSLGVLVGFLGLILVVKIMDWIQS